MGRASDKNGWVYFGPWLLEPETERANQLLTLLYAQCDTERLLQVRGQDLSVPRVGCQADLLRPAAQSKPYHAELFVG